jgi:hypothetical protein
VFGFRFLWDTTGRAGPATDGPPLGRSQVNLTGDGRRATVTDGGGAVLHRDVRAPVIAVRQPVVGRVGCREAPVGTAGCIPGVGPDLGTDPAGAGFHCAAARCAFAGGRGAVPDIGAEPALAARLRDFLGGDCAGGGVDDDRDL